jgi:hypothetical protein
MDQQKSWKAVMLSMNMYREYLKLFGDDILLTSTHFIQMFNRPRLVPKTLEIIISDINILNYKSQYSTCLF